MTIQNADFSPDGRGPFRAARVFIFFGLALLITGGISLLFADLLWRRGWTSGSTILLILFVLLLFLNVAGGMHGIYGFFFRGRRDPHRITNLKDLKLQDISETSTAILFPIYNESAGEVYARLKATYLSLKEAGELAHFDFHILSDSTEPENWIDEEFRWIDLVKSLDASGRIFYRRRLWNEAKKSGNIRDFLNTVGNRYRYFIVFDADSFMAGKTITTLVKLMEAHPRVGLIQTPPAAINAESLFGRLHQFANRLYGPLFTCGSNYWVQGYGNYIGHNAIIRTEPFMKYCGLPKLPGKKPFGGHILSHDFVEAALLVQNHWAVWLAYDLDESYEECPQGLIEYAARDRRWCQGNLQHILVIFARGIRGVSRVHFLFGIFSYLSGPLWLLFMLTFTVLAFQNRSDISETVSQPRTPYLDIGIAQHALLVFALSTLVLIAPKILALLALALDRARARLFGGLGNVSLSAFLELVFSTLQAPILMLWHTQFVFSILFGRSVSWGKQNRQADGTTWAFAVRQHWIHTLVGLSWAGLLGWKDPVLLAWFLPVLAGMLLAIPFSVLTSRRSTGQAARQEGLFLTPEETEPSRDIRLLQNTAAEAATESATPARSEGFLSDVLADPYLNALHVSLLASVEGDAATREALKRLSQGKSPVMELSQKILKDGLDGLTKAEVLLVLSDLPSVKWLHTELWRRSLSALSLSWRRYLEELGKTTQTSAV